MSAKRRSNTRHTWPNLKAFGSRTEPKSKAHWMSSNLRTSRVNANSRGGGMNQDMHSITRHFKLATYANGAPRIGKDPNDPIWNRVHADLWSVKIGNPKPEAEIDAIYDAESEGILADMVIGWVEYLNLDMRLNPPNTILDAIKAYQQREDPNSTLRREHVCRGRGPHGAVV